MLDYLTNGNFTKFKNKTEYHREEFHKNREELKNCIQEAIDKIDSFNIVSIGDVYDVYYYDYDTKMRISGNIKVTSISDKQIGISGKIHKNGKKIKKCRIGKQKFYFNFIPDLVQKIINRSKIIDDVL